TVWQLPNMWRSPTRGTVVKFGLALAGALLSKFSSGLLFFVFVALALSLRCKRLPEQPVEKTELRRWRRRAWSNLAKGTLWAALFVYIVYLVLPGTNPPIRFRSSRIFPLRRSCGGCSCRCGSTCVVWRDLHSVQGAGPLSFSAILIRTESGSISPCS